MSTETLIQDLEDSCTLAKSIQAIRNPELERLEQQFFAKPGRCNRLPSVTYWEMTVKTLERDVSQEKGILELTNQDIARATSMESRPRVRGIVSDNQQGQQPRLALLPSQESQPAEECRNDTSSCGQPGTDKADWQLPVLSKVPSEQSGVSHEPKPVLQLKAPPQKPCDGGSKQSGASLHEPNRTVQLKTASKLCAGGKRKQSGASHELDSALQLKAPPQKPCDGGPKKSGASHEPNRAVQLKTASKPCAGKRKQPTRAVRFKAPPQKKRCDGGPKQSGASHEPSRTFQLKTSPQNKPNARLPDPTSSLSLGVATEQPRGRRVIKSIAAQTTIDRSLPSFEWSTLTDEQCNGRIIRFGTRNQVAAFLKPIANESRSVAEWDVIAKSNVNKLESLMRQVTFNVKYHRNPHFPDRLTATLKCRGTIGNDKQKRSPTDLFKTQVAQLFGTKYPDSMKEFVNEALQDVLEKLESESE